MGLPALSCRRPSMSSVNNDWKVRCAEHFCIDSPFVYPLTNSESTCQWWWQGGAKLLFHNGLVIDLKLDYRFSDGRAIGIPLLVDIQHGLFKKVNQSNS
jgi:hypothetical protein